MIYFVCGPTAVGKSSFAIELAKKIGGEIISCDSIQVYRYINIGTAKILKSEMCCIQHHMIDVVDPNVKYCVADYKLGAMQCVKKIQDRGNVPIFVGGTGLYANAILFDYNFNNTKKSIRDMDMPIIDADVTVLNCERAELNRKIDRRVEWMFDNALEQEVRSLIEAGYDFECQGMKGIGYKEFEPYFSGQITLSEVKENIKKNSRAYAKRQLTWFRSWKFAKWVNV